MKCCCQYSMQPAHTISTLELTCLDEKQLLFSLKISLSISCYYKPKGDSETGLSYQGWVKDAHKITPCFISP